MEEELHTMMMVIIIKHMTPVHKSRIFGKKKSQDLQVEIESMTLSLYISGVMLYQLSYQALRNKMVEVKYKLCMAV